MSYVELASAVSDVAVGIAATVGGVVAWRGLKTWRDQLRGTTEYELARRVLRNIYKVRDAVYGVRISYMVVPEVPQSVPATAEEISAAESRYLGLSSVYQERWNRVVEAHRELDPDLLEAEVLWGKDLHDRLAPIRKLEHQLYTAVRFHLDLQNPAVPAPRKDSIERVSIAQNHGDIMYDTTEGEDAFVDEYAAAVQKIEDYLRPHFRRP